ncbi:MAG TPA: TatD family hydrolase [Candidatus Hydrogenedentes bacterium]|mgnify:CR=1 FL=1|nr:TatD family hydrolase [Candidatus Hydrogenedentota bacterium]
MKLIDVHCHLEAEEFHGRLDTVVQNAREAGIVKMITASIIPEQWPVSQSIAQEYPEAAFAWGVHPWYIQPGHLEAVEGLRAARDAGACAIGEIGLDGKIDEPAMEIQLPLFEAQVCIAKELDLPVILHCRGAFNEMLEVFKRYGAPERGGIIHAFSGSMEIAEAFIRHGMSFSMGGALTYKKNNKRAKTLARIYPDHFLLETDSPDIPPVQALGQPNVPANILHNLRGAAEYLSLPEESIAQQTTQNAARLFQFVLP